MPYNVRRAPRSDARTVALDEVADALTQPAAPGERAELARWRDHDAVYLLRFPSNGAQKAAMARLSLFLEDAQLRGAHLSRRRRPRPPTRRRRRCGVASSRPI